VAKCVRCSYFEYCQAVNEMSNKLIAKRNKTSNRRLKCQKNVIMQYSGVLATWRAKEFWTCWVSLRECHSQTTRSSCWTRIVYNKLCDLLYTHRAGIVCPMAGSRMALAELQRRGQWFLTQVVSTGLRLRFSQPEHRIIGVTNSVSRFAAQSRTPPCRVLLST